MLKPDDDIAHLTNEFVRTARQHRDVDIRAFGHVAEERAFDEFLVQGDEEHGNDAPEQENDGQALRV